MAAHKAATSHGNTHPHTLRASPCPHKKDTNLFALLCLFLFVVGASAAQRSAKRYDRSRIATGYIPMPPHERPSDAKRMPSPTMPIYARR